MTVDAHKNFASWVVATAPSSPTAGTSLVVGSGTGSRAPAVPFNAVVCPGGTAPTVANAEIIRVTARSSDTFGTIVRAQEGTSARSIQVGDRVFVAVTTKTLTDIETDVAARAPLSQAFSGEAPLEIFYDSATFNSTLDPIAKFGSNPRWTGSQSACYWGVEGDYNDGTNHMHEAYLNYDSADKSTVVAFRPIYIAIRKNANANHAATILFDVGTDGSTNGSSFAIQAGPSTTFLTINSLGAFFAAASSSFSVKIGTDAVLHAPTTQQATIWTFPYASAFATTRTANTLYVCAVQVTMPCLVTGMQIHNDSVVSGNVEVALYNYAGTTKLAASVSTAQAGTFSQQFVAFSAAATIQPGTYWLAVIIDNATGKLTCCDPWTGNGTISPGSFTTPSTITPPSDFGRLANIPVMATY